MGFGSCINRRLTLRGKMRGANLSKTHGGNQLYLVGVDGRDAIVFDVSEATFLDLQRDPSAESTARILQSHHWEYV